MMKNRVPIMLLSLALLVSIAVSGIWANEISEPGPSDLEETADLLDNVYEIPVEDEEEDGMQELPNDDQLDAQEPEESVRVTDFDSGELSLFEQIVACNSLEEIYAVIEEMTEEEAMSFSEEEIAQIEAKIAELEPEPLPPVVLETSADEPVTSEIVYPTVNFDNVAPFGGPVSG